ncbi:MAG: hypothetical protein ACRBN8_38890 [Nannocystales bacterium]
MSRHHYPCPTDFHRDIGSPEPPTKVTQKAFDYEQAPLEALAARVVGVGPCGREINEYALDLMHAQPLQPDLMAHVLPLCLETWQHGLRSGALGGVIEQLHASLAKRRTVITDTLGPDISDVFYTFIRQSLLARMEEETSLRHNGMDAPPHRWFSCLASYGTLGPNVGEVLGMWNRIGCVGHAVAWIQYASVLAFDGDDNPVFDPWTPDAGGGPPALWEYASTGFEERWDVANLGRLREFLEPGAVIDRTERAASQLADHQHAEVVRTVHDAVQRGRARLQWRRSRLCEVLATPSTTDLLDWGNSP